MKNTFLEGEERFGDLETPTILRRKEKAEAEDSKAEDQREKENWKKV